MSVRPDANCAALRGLDMRITEEVHPIADFNTAAVTILEQHDPVTDKYIVPQPDICAVNRGFE